MLPSAPRPDRADTPSPVINGAAIFYENIINHPVQARIRSIKTDSCCFTHGRPGHEGAASAAAPVNRQLRINAPKTRGYESASSIGCCKYRFTTCRYRATSAPSVIR